MTDNYAAFQKQINYFISYIYFHFMCINSFVAHLHFALKLQCARIDLNCPVLIAFGTALTLSIVTMVL